MTNFQEDKTQESAAASRNGDTALRVNEALEKNKNHHREVPTRPTAPSPPGPGRASPAGRRRERRGEPAGPGQRCRHRGGAGERRGGSPPPPSRPPRAPPATTQRPAGCGQHRGPRPPYLRQRGRGEEAAAAGACPGPEGRKRPRRAAQGPRVGAWRGPGGHRLQLSSALPRRPLPPAWPPPPGPGDTPRGGRRFVVAQPPLPPQPQRDTRCCFTALRKAQPRRLAPRLPSGAARGAAPPAGRKRRRSAGLPSPPGHGQPAAPSACPGTGTRADRGEGSAHCLGSGQPRCCCVRISPCGSHANALLCRPETAPCDRAASCAGRADRQRPGQGSPRPAGPPRRQRCRVPPGSAHASHLLSRETGI